MAQSMLRQIKASAGSGKTHTLTSLFLQHLAHAPSRAHEPSCAFARGSNGGWGDIIAITFTNSAAAEMKERVVRRLKETALGLTTSQGIPPQAAKVWVDTILRQYGALNIRTIDSLLHLIVRTAALDLGLPPDFETTFSTDETLSPIFDALLEKAWQGDAHTEALLRAVCRSLLFHAEVQGFSAGSRILDALRPLLDHLLTQNMGTLSPLDKVEARLAEKITEYTVLGASLCKAIQEEGLACKKLAGEAFAKSAEGKLAALGSAWFDKANLDECLLAKSAGKASEQTCQTFLRLTEVVGWLRVEGHILRKALELAPYVELAAVIAEGLEEFQQRESKVPGTVIPRMARDVLSLEHGVPTALCRLGSSLNHLLLDEFQDTSRQQWGALHPLVGEALSRGGSLTFVGDVKQAIYGWRGGDASLFDTILQDASLACMVPAPEQNTLPVNWRSREVVVRTNNNFFAPLAQFDSARQVLTAMLAQDCPAHVLDAGAQRLVGTFAQATQECRPDGAAGGFVTMREVKADRSEDLSHEVREALRERLMDDVARRRKWGEITILVRSNQAAAEVAQWLMEWQAPVITENSLLLGAHPLVAESLALLAFLDCPQDDLAFWTVITGQMLAPCLAKGKGTENDSAEGGAEPSLEELRDWALTRRKGFLCMAFRETWPLFWQRWFAPFHGKAGLMTPYDIVQEWYRLLQVPQRFPLAATFLRRFLEILHTAGERGSATLSTFLHYWQENGGDEKAPMPSSMDAVRVMTIHKSKGLQFPVVIVPWMSFAQKQDSPPVPCEVDGLHVLAPRCKQMGDVHHEAQAQSALEALNLLYVAMTRAEEELHVFHTHTPYLLRMRNLACGLEALLPAAQLSLPFQDGEAPATAPGLADQPADFSPVVHAPEPPLPSSAKVQVPDEEWRPMDWLPRLKIFRNPLQEMTFTPRRRGMLTHHCLEKMQATGNAQEDAASAVRLGLRTFPLPVPQSESLRQELEQALSWYANLPGAEDWTREGLPEQSILDAAGNVHRVDMLIPPSQSHCAWRAIDYKTGGEEEEHLVQIRRYLALLEDLPPSQDSPPLSAPQGMLVYLDLQRCRMVGKNHVSELLSAPAWVLQGASA